METFAKLFERFLVFVYHCFDRIVIQGYLPLLSRPEHIVYFFRNVVGQYPITPQVLAKRTPEYRRWVEGYARNHKIPIQSPEKGVSKEDFVRPYLAGMERRNQHGVYCIIPSMERGSTFTSKVPKFPTDDPDYRIIRRVWSRYLHYYFYIRDPVLGPMSMCVGTYLPFQTTYYLNGHHFMEIELRNQNVAFRKDDNAFLATADPKALQAAADKLSAVIIRKRLDYWSWLKDRDGAPDLVWLPPVIPANVRLVISTLPGRPLEDLHKRSWPSLTVEPLRAEERRQLITDYLALQARSLSPGPRRTHQRRGADGQSAIPAGVARRVEGVRQP